MQSFLLKENILRFRRLLEWETDPALRRTVLAMLIDSERDLAKLEIERAGAAAGLPPGGVAPLTAWRGNGLSGEFHRAFDASPEPLILIHPGAGLHIVDLNDAYADLAMVNRLRVAGERLFDAFPDNDADPEVSATSRLFASLCTAAETGRRHVMSVIRYDIRDPDGTFVERYWRLENVPIYDGEDRLAGLLLQPRNVTEEVLAGRIVVPHLPGEGAEAADETIWRRQRAGGRWSLG
jgi:PAS domain-containing protein